MSHRVSNALTLINRLIVAALLLLTLAAAGLWRVSQSSQEFWRWTDLPMNADGSANAWTASIGNGSFKLHHGPAFIFCGTGLDSDKTGFAGFYMSRVYYGTSKDKPITRRWQLPLWSPMVLFAVYPFFFLMTTPLRRRRFRRTHGMCIRYGYDLRASYSGACPECDAPFSVYRVRQPIAARSVDST